MEPWLERALVPAALLAGFGVLALTLDRGLSRIANAVELARGEGPPAAAQLGAAAASAPALAPPLVPSVPQPAPVDSALMARDREIRISEQAQEGLLAQQSAYHKACDLRVLDPKASFRPLRFDVKLTFGADGMELSRELIEFPPPSARVSECAKGLRMPKLTIPAPGATVTTTGRLDL